MKCGTSMSHSPAANPTCQLKTTFYRLRLIIKMGTGRNVTPNMTRDSF